MRSCSARLVALSLIVFCLTGSASAQTDDPTDLVFADDVLPTVRITMAEADLAALLDPNNQGSDFEHRARFVFESSRLTADIDSVGFRLRGNTSRASQKKSFKVSFNTFVTGRKFNGLEKMNLNGEHNDPSVVRSKLAWDLFIEAGLPATRANHVRLFINETYFGLYMNVEHIDEHFLDRHFGNDSGNLYKCLWPADLTWKGSTGAAYRPSGSSRAPYDLKLKDNDLEGYDDLAQFISVINTTSDSAFPGAIESVFNVNGFLRAMAVTVVTGSWDTYWFLKNNFYLYFNPATEKFEYVPFDFDNSFGIWWDGISPNIDWAERDVYAWGHPNEPRPLATRILAVPEFRDRYTFYLRRLIERSFDADELTQRAYDLRDLTAAAAEADPFRPLDWDFSVQDYYDSFTIALGSRSDRQGHVTHGLVPFLHARAATATAQLDALNIAPILSEITLSPQVLRPLNALTVTARVEDELSATVVIEYWPDRPERQEVEMSPAPDLGPEMYRGTVPPMGAAGTLDLRLRASDPGGNERISSLYRIAVDGGRPAVYINEIMAINTTTVADEWGDFDDWVEIHNAGPTPIALGQFTLTDDVSIPDRFVFPDTTLATGGYLIVWTDGTPEQGSMHASFKLSGSGEEVALYDPTGVNLDVVTFGAQADDVSMGRPTDGNPVWTVQRQPTPGAANAGATDLEGNLVNDSPHALRSATAYPNPTRSGVELQVSSEPGDRVQAVVFDLLGRSVARFQPNGSNRLSWDGSADRTLAAGLYLVRVTWMDAAGRVAHTTTVPSFRIQ